MTLSHSPDSWLCKEKELTDGSDPPGAREPNAADLGHEWITRGTRAADDDYEHTILQRTINTRIKRTKPPRTSTSIIHFAAEP